VVDVGRGNEDSKRKVAIGARPEKMKQGLLWYVWPRIPRGLAALEIDWFASSRTPAPTKHPRSSCSPRLEIAESSANLRHGRASWASIDCQRPIQVLGSLAIAHRAHVGGSDDDYL